MMEKLKEKIRILYINNIFDNTSGSGVIALNTYDLFNKDNIAEIFTVKKHQNYEEHKYHNYFIKPYDTPLKYLLNIHNFFYNRIVQKNLEAVLMDFKPDMVHVHSPWSSGLTCSIFKPINKLGIPIVMTLHDCYLICPAMTLLKGNGKTCSAECNQSNKIFCFLNNCCKNYEKSFRVSLGAYINKKTSFETTISKFITPSNALQNLMLKYNSNIDKNKIVTINNFLSRNEFGDTKPNYTNKGYFLYIGRLDIEKGVHYIVEAAKSLPKDIEFHIIGRGTEEKRLKNIVKKNNLNNIHFLGFKNRTEIKEEYQNCIATILPCNWFENFPTTNMESFINGKPVIASNIGGIPEQVEDNKTGLLFEPANVEQLKECILKYWNNPNLVIEHGKNAYEKAKTQYAEERYYRELKNIYNEVLHEH